VPDLIRIAHVVPDLAPSGPARTAASLALHAPRDQFEPVLVTLAGSTAGNLEERLREAGIGIHPSRSALSRIKPHIVHAHGDVLYSTLSPAVLRGPTARVWTIHHLPRQVSVPVRLLRRMFHPVVTSEEASRRHRELFGGPPAAVVQPGIETAPFLEQRGQREFWRKREGFGGAEVLITCIARLVPDKDHLGLLEAFSHVANARLLLAGAGPLEPALRERCHELGLAGRVHFLGVRNDVPALLAASDAVVLASRHEGTPLAVMEAMAAGRACLMTAVGAIPDLIEHGVHGLLVDWGDTMGLARSIQRLVNDPSLRQLLGQGARERAMREFGHEVMARAYERLYERLTVGWDCEPALRRESAC